MVWYVAIGMWFLDLLKAWGSLFYAPIVNPNMLWIIVPIYLNWLFAEFFQEKRETSLGNAVSNAAIILWAAVDWSRTSVNFFKDGLLTIWNLVAKVFIAVIVLVYGAVIVYQGVKGRNITHYIGRIRVVSYIVLMLTPIVYNTIELSITILFSAILFFPVFYYLIEVIDRFTPDPVPIVKDSGGTSGSGFGGSDLGGDEFKSDLGGDDFKI